MDDHDFKDGPNQRTDYPPGLSFWKCSKCGYIVLVQDGKPKKELEIPDCDLRIVKSILSE